MADRDVDLAVLAFRREVLLALFAQRSARLHLVQAAVLAATGISTIGWASGSLPPGMLPVLLGGGAALYVGASRRLVEHESAMLGTVGRLLEDAESLKRRGGP